MNDLRTLIYLVWIPPNPEVDDDEGYHEHFTSLQDAVTAHPGEEIFTAKPRLLGRFKMKNVPVRLRSKKRKKLK